MFIAIRERLEDREEGFTLIELLVVVIIIGILAAIAIPTFLRQRERAWEKAVLSDLRNSAVLMEEYFNDEGTYDQSVGTAVTFRPSQGVQIAVTIDTATRYCLDATHDNLNNGEEFVLDSNKGQAMKVGEPYGDGTNAVVCA